MDKTSHAAHGLSLIGKVDTPLVHLFEEFPHVKVWKGLLPFPNLGFHDEVEGAGVGDDVYEGFVFLLTLS